MTSCTCHVFDKSKNVKYRQGQAHKAPEEASAENRNKDKRTHHRQWTRRDFERRKKISQGFRKNRCRAPCNTGTRTSQLLRQPTPPPTRMSWAQRLVEFRQLVGRSLNEGDLEELKKEQDFQNNRAVFRDFCDSNHQCDQRSRDAELSLSRRDNWASRCEFLHGPRWCECDSWEFHRPSAPVRSKCGASSAA
jgi:hypothetical protein